MTQDNTPIHIMDPELAKAAYAGDVKFLRKFFADCQTLHNNDHTCCFLAQQPPEKPNKNEAGNIFHLSGRNNRFDFFKEAIHILPNSLVHTLLTQKKRDTGRNPLHVAARVGHIAIVKLIIDFYKKPECDQAHLGEPKPWLECDTSKRSPLHLGLYYGKDDCVMEMILMIGDDTEKICNMVDEEGNSLLILAVKNGCDRVAMHILKNVSSYSDSGKNELTPLHFVMNSSEEVLAKLLDKHPEYKEKLDHTLLHKWIVSKGKLWPLEYLFYKRDDIKPKRQLAKLIYQTNLNGNNAFHIAAKSRKPEAAKTLAGVYRDDRAERFRPPKNPWLIRNNKHETPMGLAVLSDYETSYEEYEQFEQEIIGMSKVTEGKRELLLVAIEKRLYCAAEVILGVCGKYGWSLYPPEGWEIWDDALELSEEAAIWVAGKMFPERVEFIDHSLYSASEKGKTKFIKYVLKKYPNALDRSPLCWIAACENGHISTVMAFINNNCDYFLQLCNKNKDTPLHHIRFQVNEQYEHILKNPVMSRLKNFPDSVGQTPLHKAVTNGNLLLAKFLLSVDEVPRNIKDNSQHTAIDLLVEAAKENWEWDEMCQQAGIISGMKMTYFQDKNNLLEVRNTLSVVAVLLATITFTAGFTLPGGVKSDTTGKPALGNKTAFLMFLISDTLAMCCSMWVLVCLVWSMVCEYRKALAMVNKSVRVLMLSLCSTMVAFMTGVYVVIPHKKVWIAVIMLIMCSVFIISSKRSIMDKLLQLSRRNVIDILHKSSRFALRRRSKDNFNDLERGEASHSKDWILENVDAFQQQKSE